MMYNGVPSASFPGIAPGGRAAAVAGTHVPLPQYTSNAETVLSTPPHGM